MSATEDEVLAVAVALERRWVKEKIVEVYRWALNRGGPDPFWSGFELACDEITVRLQEAYGETPTDTGAWLIEVAHSTPSPSRRST